MNANPESWPTDPSWLLHGVDWRRQTVTFTRTSRRELSWEPFLDTRWSREGAPEITAPLDGFTELQPPGPPPLFLWHTAFCGSTLLARCLDRRGRCLSLKEPWAVTELAAAARLGHASPGLIAAAWSSLGRGFEPGERVLIKPSNGANTLLADMGARGERMVLLNSSLRHFLLSVARPIEARRPYVRHLMANRVMCGRVRLDPGEFALMTDLQIAALLWRAQIAEFEAAAARLGPDQVRRIDSAALLADPAAVVADLDVFFGLGLGDARIAASVAQLWSNRNAKVPTEGFDADAHQRALDEVERTKGPALDELEAWSADWVAGADRRGGFLLSPAEALQRLRGTNLSPRGSSAWDGANRALGLVGALALNAAAMPAILPL